MARSNFTEVEQPIFRDPFRSSLSFFVVFSICLRPSKCLSSLLQLFFPHKSLSGYFLWKYRARDETLRPRLIIGRVRCSLSVALNESRLGESEAVSCRNTIKKNKLLVSTCYLSRCVND